MQSQIDVPGGDIHHGNTVDDNGTVWYWEWDGESVEFTDRGVPTDHPIRDGPVPDDVRDHAETHVDALIEQEQTPHY